MTKLKQLLAEEKRKIDELEIPQELETRLHKTLTDTSKRKFEWFNKRIAILIIFILFSSYNLDALAYYGKKLVGYDQVMTGTLQELNDLGKGQKIEKSYTFSDGVTVHLDGVMLDDNSLIVYYFVQDPSGNIQNVSERMNIDLTRIFERGFSSSSTGEFDEDGKILRCVLQTHEPPKFFDNTLKLTINYTTENGEEQNGEIDFKLDRNQAVGKSIRVPINKKISIDKRSITINTLTASPTSTVVKGQIQNIVELGIDHINKNRIYPENIEMVLYANDKEIVQQGSGMSTNQNGINFYLIFDRLPESTDEIQLKLLSFLATFDVDQEITLTNIENENKVIDINGQSLYIDSVTEKEESTYVSISTEETTTIPQVHLYIDDEKKELLETNSGDYEIRGDGKTYYKRTLKFAGTGQNLRLHIQKIRYKENYDQFIFNDRIK